MRTEVMLTATQSAYISLVQDEYARELRVLDQRRAERSQIVLDDLNVPRGIDARTERVNGVMMLVYDAPDIPGMYPIGDPPSAEAASLK